MSVALLLALAAAPAYSQKDARAIVASAVQTELESDRNDHTAFMYRDHDVTPDHDTLYYVVETPRGNLKRKLEDHGRPLTPDERRADDDSIAQLLGDTSLQARQQRDSAHDDEQAEQMLRLLPRAYLWTLAGESGDLITLDFKPDPAFKAENTEARVLGSMGGQVVIAKNDNRIYTIRGTLLTDIIFGMKWIGHLRKGGTFEVERREIVPHHWQIVESNVRIEGHALFFKSIGSVEHETRSDFRISNVENLQQAYDLLKKQ